MNNLEKRLNKIKKSYFSFADARKISEIDDTSLRVAVSRLIKSGKIISLAKGYYCLDPARVDWPKMALEVYAPSYLSFEWILGQSGILSQKSYSLTLATTKRARQIEAGNTLFAYRHLQEKLFFGYIIKDGYLMAEPEKAFLDLAYLSLNGCANFDPEEMNLSLLNKNKLKQYLKRFSSRRLDFLIGKLFITTKH